MLDRLGRRQDGLRLVYVQLCESDDSVFSRDAVVRLLQEESITWNEELLVFLEGCMDHNVAAAFTREWEEG